METQVKSAMRVLEVFELFAAVQAPMRLGELVAHTGYPQSSMAALLATLTRAGYLVHDRKARNYQPSTQLTQLGMWVQASNLSHEPSLMDMITRLSAATGETVVVGERAGSYARYLHVIPPAGRPIMFHTQAGVVRPLCSSAMGLALLSRMSDDELRAAVQSVRRDMACAHLQVKLPEVRRRIDEVRRLGFVMSRNGVFQGTSMVALPLPRPVRGRLLAVGLGAPTTRLDSKLAQMIDALRSAIDAWSRI